MKQNYFLISLVIFIFAIISFSSNIIGPLASEISNSFNGTAVYTGMLSLSFFIAYILSIPFAFFAEKTNEKTVIVVSFLFAALGALMFSIFPNSATAIISFFMIGIGMASLQVVINPLLRSAGGKENFAFYSVVAQIVFGGAAVAVSQFSGWASNNNASFPSFMVNETYPWAVNYSVIFVTTGVIGLLIIFLKLPKTELEEDEQTADKNTYFKLIGNKKIFLFFLGIFSYVGTEQGVSVRIKEFLIKYHGMQASDGDDCISYYWLLLTIGCLLGIVLVKLFDIQLLLKIFSFAAIISLVMALTASEVASFYSFTAVGFFLSIMWSAIISLGLNATKFHPGAVTGILCTGIIGGAITPFIIGIITDLTGGNLVAGISFNFLTLAYIFSIGFWAKPLVKNKTVKLGELFKKG